MFAKCFLEDAATARKLGKRLTDESPYGGSLHLAGTLVRRAMTARKAEDWSVLLKSDELSPWTTAMPQEFEAVVVPVKGQGALALSYVCPHCHLFPIDGKIEIGGVQRAAARTTG